MMRALTAAAVSALTISLGLVACTEKPQTAGTHNADASAYSGTVSSDPFAAPGWKAGDQASWDEQIKTRTQGQNEYNRASNSPRP